MNNRRQFLQSAAAASLAWAARPAQARAAANNRLTLGFIGVGTMGRYHLGAFLGRDDVEVIAVCDVVQERTNSAREMVEGRYAERKKSGDFRGVKGFNDFRELLGQSGLDAVVIATPDHWHVQPAILAARAGKHVYCEKPLTHNVAEGRQLVNEVAKAKIAFQTGSQQRSEFGGHFRRAVELIWNGRIGRVKRVRIGVGAPSMACDLPEQPVPEGTDWDRWLGPAPLRPYNEVLCPKGVHGHYPAWRNYWEYAGGPLADMGAHHFDIAQWALEMDTSGPVLITPPENPAQLAGLRMLYANGIEIIHNEFEGDVKADCVFEGTDGTLLVSRGGIATRPEGLLAPPLPENARQVPASTNHHQNWLEAIRGGAPAICSAETGHRSATLCHLANIAYRLRRPLKWNPARELFIQDPDADKLLIREIRPGWNLLANGEAK
ncbi:MAG: Gfo/Idh/MocA family protein [Planctomycetaceae bacterium]